jgi:hypothetical protein
MRNRSFAARRSTSSLTADFADFLKGLLNRAVDPYRPELHYMRGPGPKWHAKHAPAPASFEGMPALVRVRSKG